MADRSEPLVRKIAPFLLYALPIAGGLAGVAYVNTTVDGNPFIWIAIGAVIGRVLAHLIVKLIEVGAAAGALDSHRNEETD